MILRRVSKRNPIADFADVEVTLRNTTAESMRLQRNESFRIRRFPAHYLLYYITHLIRMSCVCMRACQVGIVSKAK